MQWIPISFAKYPRVCKIMKIYNKKIRPMHKQDNLELQIPKFRKEFNFP